ncbi:MAG: hypothetical protein AABM29_05795 [Actinomycetota bacterium]
MRSSWLLAALLGIAAVALAGIALARDSGTSLAADNEGPPGFRDVTPERKPVIFDIGGLVFDAEARVDAMVEARGLGAEALRVLVPWGMVAPEERPQNFRPANPADPNYDWTVYDPVLEEARRHDLKILLSPSGPAPEWASEPGSEGIANPDPKEFGAFVTALAKRYGGEYDPDGPGGSDRTLPKVAIWAVWNEPNLSIFLQPQYKDGRPYSPILYRELYLAAQRSIEAEQPDTPILFGETAPTGSTDSVNPIPFAREALCLDATFSERPNCPGADESIDAVGWSAHPYSLSGQEPFEPVPDPGYVTMSSLGTLENTLDQAATAGAIEPELPIYITEFGVQSLPDPNAGVTLGHQAEFIAIAEQIAYTDPRIKTFAQYLLRDDSPDTVAGTEFGGFESGLRFYDGRAKPAYDAFLLPLAVQRLGERVSLWGITQPYTGSSGVTIRYKDPGEPARKLREVATNQGGVYSFTSEYRDGRLWLAVWKAPSNGKTYRSPWIRSYQFAQPPTG